MMWRFFWIRVMIFIASTGGLGMNWNSTDSACASILLMPSGLAAMRSLCVSIKACVGAGNLPKRSINSS